MTTAVLDINDQSLLIMTDLEQSYSECGFAQLSNKGITCGADAYALHWQVPQSSFNDYWRHLNQLPLPHKQQWARHNADIAFAQLQQMLLAAGSPEKVILSVPGSFSDAQLALLVGLLNATSSALTGVIDSGLMAALMTKEDGWIVELHLHQTVLSLVHFEHSNGQTNLIVAQQEIIPDLGILQIHNTVANHISDRFIKDYRYDPLHDSAGEQAIYAQMADWLSDIVIHNETLIVLNTPSGDLSLTIHKDDIVVLLQRRLDHLTRVLSTQSETNIAFTESATLIPLLSSDYADSDNIRRVDAAMVCLDIAERVFSESAEPIRVSSLQISSLSAPERVLGSHSRNTIATHLLHEGEAWSLDGPVSISIRDGQLRLSNHINKAAAVCLVIRDNSLRILHQQTGCRVVLPVKCSRGETLIVGEHSLVLIEVIHG